MFETLADRYLDDLDADSDAGSHESGYEDSDDEGSETIMPRR